VPGTTRTIDRRGLERAAHDLLVALGVDLGREGLADTPLTTQIAAWLRRELSAKGVGVVLEADHLCMTLRGVREPGAKTVTSALHGLVRDDPRTREDFLSLTGWRTR
jgi:GTP cyclohydrolase I